MESYEAVCFIVCSDLRTLDIGDVGIVGISRENDLRAAAFQIFS